MKNIIFLSLLIGLLSSCNKELIDGESDRIFDAYISVDDNEVFERDTQTGRGRTGASFTLKNCDQLDFVVEVRSHFTLSIWNGQDTEERFKDLCYNWYYSPELADQGIHQFRFEKVSGDDTKIPILMWVDGIDQNDQTTQPVQYKYKLGNGPWEDFNVNFLIRKDSESDLIEIGDENIFEKFLREKQEKENEEKELETT